MYNSTILRARKMAIVCAVICVLVLVAVVLTAPSGGTDPKATTLDEFSVPTVSKDRLKPKLYGTRWITGPNVCDYGAYSTVAIRK